MQIEKTYSLKKVTINVGSKNPAKISAAKDAFLKYFDEVDILGFDVQSEVSSQPMSLDEDVLGAKKRAIDAFEKRKCDYSIGIEAGPFKFPGRTGWIETGVAVIYDGKEFFYGGSPLFEYPKFIIEKIHSEGKEVGTILDEHLNKKDMKHNEGVIGWLSENRMKRKEYAQIAVFMALVSLMNKELY